jgi:hypothetical protein
LGGRPPKAPRERPSNRSGKTWLAGVSYRKHTLAATQYSGNLRVWVRVDGVCAKALIDSGATANFMSPSFAERANIRLKAKHDAYTVTAVDGELLGYNNGVVNRETQFVELTIGPHRGKMQFDITVTGQHDLVLGLPWLRDVNPSINWARQTMDFSSGRRVKLSEDAPERSLKICALSSTEFKKEIQENPNDVKVLWSKTQKERDSKFELPSPYRGFAELFADEAPEEALPAHREWDHSVLI